MIVTPVRENFQDDYLKRGAFGVQVESRERLDVQWAGNIVLEFAE